jgi:hypothetical protein
MHCPHFLQVQDLEHVNQLKGSGMQYVSLDAFYNLLYDEWSSTLPKDKKKSSPPTHKFCFRLLCHPLQEAEDGCLIECPVCEVCAGLECLTS